MQIRYEFNINDYFNIPGAPIAYWLSKNFALMFKKGKPIEGIGSVRTGMSTGDNDLYLRLWFETNNNRINFYEHNIDLLDFNSKPWIPYNKGRAARKWYGNNEYIVLWREHKKFHRPRPNFKDIYLKKGLTWSFVTTGMFSSRYYKDGFLWDVAGSPCVFNSDDNLYYVLAFLSTKIAAQVLKLINPTLNCQVVDIQRVPIILNSDNLVHVNNIAKESIKLSNSDWDSFETSWDFKKHPLI